MDSPKWIIHILSLLFALIAINECVELSDLNKSQLNRLNISFNYKPKDDETVHQQHHRDVQRDHRRRDANLLLGGATNDDSSGICLFSNIKLKLEKCFKTYNSCKPILDCIKAMDLVQTCNHINMYTPTIWILNVFEILQENNFCKIPLSGCPTLENDLQNENQYLIKLNEILDAANKFGPAYLNQPRVDNKIYCSKSHNLVSNVRDLFDSLDQCSSYASMDNILNLIEDTSDIILDKNCLYCISANSFFDDCEMFNYNHENNCNASLKCIYEKIDLYKCNKEKDETPLALLSTFMTNINFVCNANLTEAILVTDWFKSLNSCIRERRYLGLTYIQAPPHINLCQEMEETYKCIHNTLNEYKSIRSRVKNQFAIFSRHFDKLQRTCDLMSLADMEKASTKTAPLAVESTRHPFQNNSEQTVLEDNKIYYHQSIVRAELDQSINWIDIDLPKFASFLVKRDEDLSKNYLKATVVRLKFKFPYYGHLLDQIVVATGGFIYVGSLMNPLITKAQYIAPLMANFDPTLSNNTMIKYVDNTTHFICTWHKLMLQDQPENGEYTFQVVLNKNGDITFNYKSIPSVAISNVSHTVKIGLSDAYIYFKVLSTAKIEYTIVQYHSVSVSLENVKTGNSIMFYMLKNCVQLKTCETCLEGVGNFKCMWCPTLQRCSDTMDRHRQEWIESQCPTDKNSFANMTCQALSMKTAINKADISSETESDGVKNVLIGVFVTVIIAMIFTLVCWVVYAYRNPNSASGIWLIEHRPQRIVTLINNNLKRETTASTRFENPIA